MKARYANDGAYVSPQSVRKAFALAKLYESVDNQSTLLKFPPKWGKPTSNAKTIISAKPPLHSDHQVEPLKLKPASARSLTLAYMNERRAKGLCYFCDMPYTPEHSLAHKKLQLHVLEMEDGCEDEDIDKEVKLPSQNYGEPTISVNALTGMPSFRTMRITGHYNKMPLHILIDSGSTHNFLDIQKANTLSCQINQLPPLMFTVADGNKLQISAGVRNFAWTIQHTTFISDGMLIPLGCCDMVLGIEWLVTLGDITWNFDKLKMEFTTQGRRHVLRGASTNAAKTLKSQKLDKVFNQGVQLSMLQLCNIEGGLLQSLTTHAEQLVILAAIAQLIEEFRDIFEKPVQLPPLRKGHNHQIPLLQDINPVNMRPYKYAKHQKDIIEKLLQEMLDSGIIQNSNSPYASPVVLVGKKDGSWRLCVDYRGLNKGTVKDRFPIPLVEDLMDELPGSTIFSKLDLRAGYHQVRMETSDIYKNAFRTHRGHYEYLVMPFGLTNAPATFQGFMNAIFSEFLRKFLLVFFDDILIYSKSLDEHVDHLKRVLQFMQRHALFAKKSKCYFGVDMVEYLGHFISAQGVSTDASKISVVKDWPLPQTLKQLRCFLGLASYYRRFVKGFGGVAKPLT
ncbi:PREDICTED: uncharacterized protein LOC109326644 [Lupinus angustifolius]|uniref:uncharacterized protein LOC109326644 n=1 Tax=Lupinus angustifolius TaxID=3871 RepID=UPI00092F4718|nr:PREDICTED: uncharacterized protein LOC109326644 [Lupinus angustifolius]